ncbi:unnamed protein product [Calypogeia fissa]
MGLDESAPAMDGTNSNPTPSVERESVVTIMKDLIDDLRNGGVRGEGRKKDQPTLQRYRHVVSKTAPRMHRSVRLMSADLVHWMNRGGPWRAFLILSTGIITSVGLSGVFVFLLFLITATVNTVIVALLASVAAVGAVAALFFTALTGIYIGVLAIAACVISTVVFFTIVAVLTVAGWIAFWWMAWLAVKKMGQIAQGSLALTASTFHSTVSSVSG